MIESLYSEVYGEKRWKETAPSFPCRKQAKEESRGEKKEESLSADSTYLVSQKDKMEKGSVFLELQLQQFAYGKGGSIISNL